VHVADLHAGAVTGQTAGAERRQTTLVGQAGQRVGLVHELRQLEVPKNSLIAATTGTDVDQGLRRDGLDVLGGHPLADDALHAARPVRSWFWISSPTVRRRRLPKWSMSSASTTASHRPSSPCGGP
jgi:hypothetical protein